MLQIVPLKFTTKGSYCFDHKTEIEISSVIVLNWHSLLIAVLNKSFDGHAYPSVNEALSVVCRSIKGDTEKPRKCALEEVAVHL